MHSYLLLVSFVRRGKRCASPLDLKESCTSCSCSLLSFYYSLPAVCHKQTGSSRNDNKQTDPSFTRSDATHPPPSNGVKLQRKLLATIYILCSSSTNLRSSVFIFMTLASEKCLCPFLLYCKYKMASITIKLQTILLQTSARTLYGRPFNHNKPTK